MKNILGILLVLVVLAVGGYWVYRQMLTPCCEPPISTPTVTASSTDIVKPDTYVIYQTTYSGEGKTIFYRQSLAGKVDPKIITEVRTDKQGPSVRGQVVEQELLVKGTFFELDGSPVFLNDTSPFPFRSHDGKVRVDYNLTYENEDLVLLMDIQIEGDNETKKMIHEKLSKTAFGLADGGKGMAEPFLVANDGNSIYLTYMFGGEHCLNNLDLLWRYDIPTRTIHTIRARQDLEIREYSVDPATNMLIGASYGLENNPDEVMSCGNPVGPSKIYRVNLLTGEYVVLKESRQLPFVNPFVSDDGSKVAFQSKNGVDVILTTLVGPDEINDKTTQSLSGKLLDWVGETQIIDRDGEIVLFDLSTKTTRLLDRTIGSRGVDVDYQEVKYLGTITIK